jgi:hypothetical protein
MLPEPFGFLIIVAAAPLIWLGERLFVWMVLHGPPQLEHED